jgi:hypothetical protein
MFSFGFLPTVEQGFPGDNNRGDRPLLLTYGGKSDNPQAAKIGPIAPPK